MQVTRTGPADPIGEPLNTPTRPDTGAPIDGPTATFADQVADRPADPGVEDGLARDGGRSRRPEVRSLLASAVVVCFLVAAVGDALPGSAIGQAIAPRVAPLVRWTGFSQPWGLFAPTPTSTEVEIYAMVTFADGRSMVWWPNRQVSDLDSTRNERWRKWGERVHLDTLDEHWPLVAAHLARELGTGSRPVERVRLVRTWSDVPPPDQPPSDRVHYDYHFYEWDATVGAGRHLDGESQPR